MELIGNEGVVRQLNIVNTSCKHNDKPIPHMLLSGAAGCGKTSTAKKLAEVNNAQFLSVTPESIKTRDSVVGIINQLDRKIGYDIRGNRIKETSISYPILFIDEIHRIPVIGQEHLGIIMEEWQIPVDPKHAKIDPYDSLGLTYKNRVKWCPMFTLIGATTNDGLLSKPFKDRFKLRFVFSPYSLEESIKIVKTHTNRLNNIPKAIKISIDDESAKEIAKRGRGVPRIIVTLLERCRDMAIANQKDNITVEISMAAFAALNIDNNGLTETDIKILKTLYNSSDPIGVENLAILVNESKQTISETIEPYLIQRELITRTGRGRRLTNKGRIYLINNGHIKIEMDPVDIPYDYVRRL